MVRGDREITVTASQDGGGLGFNLASQPDGTTVVSEVAGEIMCTVRLTLHNIKVIENASGNVIESDFVRSMKNAVSPPSPPPACQI